MSVKERTRQEREFIARMDHIPNIRMPFSSEEGYKFKLYNQEYQYNEVKNNFILLRIKTHIKGSEMWVLTHYPK